MEEGLIEIDPEFYMTCRLCVEQKGKFQIPPSLQTRIKFAFDIDIKQYDGLSQIICEKCKAMVMEMNAMKEKFQARQTALRNGEIKLRKVDPDITEVSDVEVVSVELKKVEEKPVSQLEQNGKSDSDMAPSHSSKSSACSKKKKKVRKSKKRSLRAISSSSSEIEVAKKSKKSKRPVHSDPEQPLQSESDKESLDIDNLEPRTHSWNELYYRSYVCRYCNQILSFKKSMKDHVQSHHRLVKKRNKVTRWHSVVKMERFDERPNLTGNDNIVVFSQKRLCCNDDNADYFILYTPKGSVAECSLKSSDPTYIDPNVQNPSSSDSDGRSNRKRFTCIDVTSEGEETHKPKLRKRIRLQSGGSSDTVDLQNDALQNSTSDIDDSSIDMFEPLSEIKSNKEPPPASKSIVKQTMTELPFEDYTIIKKIVSASCENIKKKKTQTIMQPKEKNTRLSIDELTKRKLLSVGRKTMVKQGLVSMGLIKVLEQRDVKIQWVRDSKSKDSMVRIITKVSASTTDNLIGFQPCVDMEDGIKETDAEKSLRMSPWLGPSKNVNIKTKKVKSKMAVPPMSLVISPLIPSAATLPPPTFPSMSPMLPSMPPLLPSVTPLLPALPHTTLTRNTPDSVATTATACPASPHLLNILNASPVANPKMAPKKKISLLKTEPLKQTIHTDHDYNGESISLDSDEDIIDSSRKGLSMPNITPKDVSRINSSMPNISPKHTSQKNLSMPNISPKDAPQVDSSLLNISPTSNPNYVDFSPTSTTKSYISNNLLVTSSASMGLPIITATTSLANIPEHNPIKNNTEEEHSESVKKPRIKCKPVSELMGSKIMTDTLVAADDISKVLENRGDTESSPALPANIPAGNIVLHTITLPNTVTKSPFDYFSRLLRMHTMILLDSSSPTEPGLATLVKFKLSVHQRPLSVMLCLTLEAKGSVFRISIKNKANEDFDVAGMSALWQWEVLKAFNSESVISRIKLAAEREPSVSVNQANLFIGLLTSIKLIDHNISDTKNHIVPSDNL